MTPEVQAQDVLDVLREQRDAANNQIVNMGAMIKALERKVAELEEVKE